MPDPVVTPAAAAAPASTEASPDAVDAMLDAVTAPAPEPAKPDYLHSPELIARQAQELGELRAYKKAQEAAKTATTVAATPVGAEFDWSNPEASLQRLLDARMDAEREKLRAEFEPQVAPARDMMVVQQLMQDSPLAQTLLSRPDVVERLKQIATNPDLGAQYADGTRTRLMAALFSIASERAALRSQAVASVKANRPENAAVASPAVASAAAVAQPAPEIPKGMDAAMDAWGKAVMSLPGARNL